MPVISVSPTASYSAWLINDNPPNPAAPTNPSVLDIIAMMQTVVAAGYTTTATCHLNPDQTVNYQVTLRIPTMADQVATLGDYVVFDGQHATAYTAAQYDAMFTVA